MIPLACRKVYVSFSNTLLPFPSPSLDLDALSLRLPLLPKYPPPLASSWKQALRGHADWAEYSVPESAAFCPGLGGSQVCDEILLSLAPLCLWGEEVGEGEGSGERERNK